MEPLGPGISVGLKEPWDIPGHIGPLRPGMSVGLKEPQEIPGNPEHMGPLGPGMSVGLKDPPCDILGHMGPLGPHVCWTEGSLGYPRTS